MEHQIGIRIFNTNFRSKKAVDKPSKRLREIIFKLEFYTQPYYQAKCEGEIKTM